LVCVDLVSKETQKIDVNELQDQEEILCGQIQNSSKTKFSILIGTSKGRVLIVQKCKEKTINILLIVLVYLLAKEDVAICLNERRIEDISLIFKKFLSVVTDQEILIFKDNLIPYKKISFGRSNKFVSLVDSSENLLVLICQDFIFLIQQNKNEEIYVQK